MAQHINFDKLVRENTPEIILGDGYELQTRRVAPQSEEYRSLLIAKMLEEFGEWVKSGDENELCDVYEVLRTIVREVAGRDDEWMHGVAAAKREYKGRLSNLVLLWIRPKEAGE